MVLPTRSRASLLKFQVAISTYEKLGAVGGDDLHQNWSRADLEREEPLLRRDVFSHACAYREYVTDDARLVLANLRSAVGLGSVALNHVEVTDVTVEAGRVSGVEARCALSGAEIRVRASCVVNAAGPWVEAVRRLVQPDVPGWLHLSKGVHVGLPIERLPVHHLLVMSPGDGRTVFVVPRDGVVYVGTTDTSYARGARVWPGITSADVEYLLAPLPKHFSVDPVSPADVVCAWSGLRPLVAEPGKKARDISRKDEIHVGPSGLLSIAGGKLTGYRPMAENVLARAAVILGRELGTSGEDPVLPGGDFSGGVHAQAASLASEAGISQRCALRLVRLYGSEAREVLGPELVAGSGILEGEIDQAVRSEGAATLEDAVYRRLRAPLYEPGVCERILEPAAARMADLLGWDEARSADELDAVRKRLEADVSFSETEDE